MSWYGPLAAAQTSMLFMLFYVDVRQHTPGEFKQYLRTASSQSVASRAICSAASRWVTVGASLSLQHITPSSNGRAACHKRAAQSVYNSTTCFALLACASRVSVHACVQCWRRTCEIRTDFAPVMVLLCHSGDSESSSVFSPMSL